MKRDMELCRKILFAIEEQYVDTAIFNLKIEDYSIEQIAYHCKLLYEADLISDYKAQYADDHIYLFAVGSLTWEGHDFLDKIREDTIWNRTKDVIVKKGLPMVMDVVKEVSKSIITSMTQGAIDSIMNGGA